MLTLRILTSAFQQTTGYIIIANSRGIVFEHRRRSVVGDRRISLLSVAHDTTVFSADVAAGSLLAVGDGHVALSRHPDPRSVAAPLHRRRRVLRGVDVVVVRVGQQVPEQATACPRLRRRQRMVYGGWNLKSVERRRRSDNRTAAGTGDQHYARQNEQFARHRLPVNHTSYRILKIRNAYITCTYLNIIIIIIIITRVAQPARVIRRVSPPRCPQRVALIQTSLRVLYGVSRNWSDQLMLERLGRRRRERSRSRPNDTST